MLSSERDHAKRARIFDEVRGEIVEAANGVKRIARGLRPPELEELGLELALQAHARTLRESGIFRVRIITADVDRYLDMTAKLALYRIVQEAISNARRHSGAESATVRLGYEDGSVTAEITDRGVGFDSSTAIDGQRGLGLIGMQERAIMLGRRVRMSSEPGQGTTVRVSLPVRRRTDDVRRDGKGAQGAAAGGRG
jgi:signal transduction histidine kinase